jgi:prophage regulatory protein
MQKYVSDAQLAEERGVHRSTIWRWTAKGLLPTPVQLSPGCTRWLRDEVDTRDAELAARRRAA